MDDIFVRLAKLPCGINEFVTPCLDGYCVYINDKLTERGRMEAYRHAVKHINGNDFEKIDVQEIESCAHDIEGD